MFDPSTVLSNFGQLEAIYTETEEVDPDQMILISPGFHIKVDEDGLTTYVSPLKIRASHIPAPRLEGVDRDRQMALMRKIMVDFGASLAAGERSPTLRRVVDLVPAVSALLDRHLPE